MKIIYVKPLLHHTLIYSNFPKWLTNFLCITNKELKHICNIMKFFVK